jgi:ATP-binding cassette, subfamily B, bacterial MsbA
MKWKFLGAVLAGMIAGVVSSAGLPFMVRHVFPLIFVDEQSGKTQQLPEWLMAVILRVTGQEPDQNMLVGVACVMLPLVFLIRGVLMFINTYYLAEVGLRVVERIRTSAFGRLQYLSLSFHQRHKDGDLMSRIIGDTGLLQKTLVRVVADVIIQPATLLGALIALMYLAVNNQGGLHLLVALFSLPLLVLPLRAIGSIIVRKARKSQGQAGGLSAHLSENLASQPEVRSYNLQESQKRLFTKLADEFVRLHLKTVKYNRLIGPAVEIVSATTIGFAVYLGARQGLSLDVFLPMILALYFAYDPVKKLGIVHGQIMQAEASLERIEEITDSRDELPEPSNPVKLSMVRGRVTFQGVSFRYDQEGILNNINLDIPPGQVVALVGPSGVGKSTLISLISRFYDVTSGRVLLDGCDVRDIATPDLRNQIALVSQHPLLFSGTVAENIMIGRPDADREALVKAAKNAHIHEDIMSFPDGYETQLGERGEGLSGGQRQRVTIARALLKDAPILILDEATSALDSEGEGKIQSALKNLTRGKTTFLIAHRFSSIRDAGRILVLEKRTSGACIVAEGTHETVYSTCQLYRQLYDQQHQIQGSSDQSP